MVLQTTTVSGLYAVVLGIGPLFVSAVADRLAYTSDHERAADIAAVVEMWMVVVYIGTGTVFGAVLEAGVLAQFSNLTLANILLAWVATLPIAIAVYLVDDFTRTDPESEPAPDPAEAAAEVND